jgi:transcriptional regulator with XRE-family HTH domain
MSAMPDISRLDEAAFSAALGKRLRQRRRLLEMTQSNVAKVIGVSFQQVQKYEQGASQVRVYQLTRLAAALRTSPTALLEGLNS